MLTNQLNYIDMVINMNMVQLCAEDDFIYEKPQCTYMNRLETETNVQTMALEMRLGELLAESKAKLERLSMVERIENDPIEQIELQ